MQTAQVIPFQFDAREVRTMLIDDQPWFVAADIASALQYLTAKDMARNLDDDEKGRQILPTPGGDQEMLVINESGLYSAILRSRKAEAKRFKK
ncbi:phage protein [Pseudomonas aeruginosa]|uniref:BRO-N domain-containing protein n=2 Tax=Pseudomonas TaxID=286 RepID=UPI000D88DAC6|nr:Bro-N domain-containing protein [Pseudomonas aeruginosa]SPZ14023.1 phage protein [Pseudomonas aeruginosa]